METIRTLELPVPLRRRLLHLRGLCGNHAEPSLELRQLAEVERAVGARLGDGLLALLASRAGALDALDVSLENIPAHTRELHAAGGPRGMLGLGRHPEGRMLYGVTALGSQICLYDSETRSSTMLPVEQWLDRLIDAEKEALREIESEEKARTFKTLSDEEVAAFQPHVVDSPRPATRFVHHPKFGRGEVLREIDSGAKLEIRFPGEEKPKVLLASFVRADD
ncbi:MAG: hypothetical protein KF901_06245 [Myxococcales bacterium]|nr:hypothetical protein [Myxococcales bacterium]